MNRKVIYALTLLAPLALGCDQGKMETVNTPIPDLTQGGTTPDLGTSPDLVPFVPPAVPTLGDQIDRMGRPAVNTALTDPFNLTGTEETTGGVKDTYNSTKPTSEKDYSNWLTTYLPKIQGNLAILDALDGTCGNQAGADLKLLGASDKRYMDLAAVLALDYLVLDTTKTSCQVYLGVEANATGLIANTDCGGRTPQEDIADETYSLLAKGTPSGVTDGVDGPKSTSPPTTDFPFLGAPNP